MKQPVEHVERPELPWRTPERRLTECGLASCSYPTITREEFLRRLDEWGQQRTAMMTCMTCYSTSGQWGTWEQDPLHAMQRAIKHDGPYPWLELRFIRRGRAAPNTPLRLELRAIAMLIQNHRDEFAKLINGLETVVNLDEKRDAHRETKHRGRRHRNHGI